MSLKRSGKNPIITRGDIPDVPPAIVDPTSVFNPGAAVFGGRTILMLRVQTRGRETHLMVAESADGETFAVRPRAVVLEGLDRVVGTVYHVYDPRITRLGDAYHIMLAMDADAGCRLGIARTDDFERFEFLGLAASEDVRNGVLFPERRGGKYLRLERPNRISPAGGPPTGDEIWLAESSDLTDWRPVACVMKGRPHYWDELIGPGPPPVKTRDGWLHIYHGVATHFGSANVYQAGAVLLDLNDPSHVLARTKENILEPREPYELVGQVPNVVFPTGMIAAEHDAEGFARPEGAVRVYYGAADTCVCLATTTVGELLRELGR